MDRIVLIHEGRQLQDNKKLSQCNVKDGDMLLIQMNKQMKMPVSN